MISLGPDFAADLSAMDAVPPSTSPGVGGAAPAAGPEADLFNAVLGQMMGQGEVDLEPGADSPDGAAADEDVDASLDIDSAELVNPMFVDAAVTAAAPIAPVATLVWTIPTAPATAAASAAIESPAAPIETFAAVDTPAGIPSPIDTPPSSELPLDAAPELSEEAAATPGPRPKAPDAKSGPPADAPAALAEMPVDLPAAQAADAPEQRQARAELATHVADAIAKPDRPARSSRHEKAPVEPKLDAAAIRPLPFVAVERAYAGNQQGSSQSFDAPKEQQLPGSPSGAHAAAQSTISPAFAVPVDGRSLMNATPAPSRAEVVDIPAATARDIDTRVPQQIVQSVRLQAINGGGEAVVRLNPHYLGEVVVAVKVEQGSVIASLQAETPAVRQWVERNEAVLRQALAEQGLQLEKLTVAEKTSETEREGAREDAREEAREEHSQQQPRRRRPQSDEATFEVTV